MCIRDEEERGVQLSALFAHDVDAARAPAALEAWRARREASRTGVDLGGVVLERELDGDKESQVPHGAGACGDAVRGRGEGAGEAGSEQFVLTRTVRANLARLGAALCRDTAVLVEGPAASGKSAMVMHVARKLGKDKSLIRIHLDDQMDSKTLLGSYVCTDTPGEFLWKPGALTQAVEQGRWVLIEDMDLAPFEILSALIPLLESRRLFIPSRNYTITARQGFRLFGTRTTGQAGRRESAGLPMLQALTTQVAVEAWGDDEVAQVVGALYPNLKEHNLVGKIAEIHALLTHGSGGSGHQAVPGVRYRRVLTTRDLLKLCKRAAAQLPAASDNGYLTEAQRELILREAMDCFCNVLPAPEHRLLVSLRLAGIIDVPQDKVEYMHVRHKPQLKPQRGHVQVGRIYLDEIDGSHAAAKLSSKGGADQAVFCGTVRALQTMEAVAAAIQYREPLLLTGETGTGKTSLVQHLASLVGAQMVVVNLNQQSDSGDLLGGFKPVEVRQLAQELMDDLLLLLPRVTSKSKNTAFLQSCRDKFEAQKWKPLIKLMLQAAALVESLLNGSAKGGGEGDKSGDAVSPGGKRKSSAGGGGAGEAGTKKGKALPPLVRRQWRAFSDKIGEFARKVEAIKGKFAFAFVEGVLVKAIREGHWLLLDEVNLAPAETLERLSGLLDGDSGSVALTEKGDIDVVQRHPSFRLFACMNPATDVGKKDLPVALRARFTEVYVDEMEEESELREVVQSYLRGTTKNQHVVDIVSFYLAARALARKGDLFDGANQKVHFNLRSLTRMLQYVNFMQMQGYTFERALFEGACMVFATQLNPSCQSLMDKTIMQHLCKTKSTAGNSKPSLSNADDYVCMGQYTHDKTEFTGFYLMKGEAFEKIPIPSFILTPSCQVRQRRRCCPCCRACHAAPWTSGKARAHAHTSACTHVRAHKNTQKHTKTQTRRLTNTRTHGCVRARGPVRKRVGTNVCGLGAAQLAQHCARCRAAPLPHPPAGPDLRRQDEHDRVPRRVHWPPVCAHQQPRPHGRAGVPGRLCLGPLRETSLLRGSPSEGLARRALAGAG